MKNTGSHAKTVNTALDTLDYGPLESPEAYDRVKKAVLPEGVTSRRLMRDVTMIAWPSLLELMLTQATSMADQIMVGQIGGAAGVQGLTAVGLASMPKFLMMTLVMAMNVGTTAIVARSRGQQNRKMANRVFRQAVSLNFWLSVFLMIAGMFCSSWMIGFMGGSGIAPETLALSTTYLKIQFMGFVPLCLTMTITAARSGRHAYADDVQHGCQSGQSVFQLCDDLWQVRVPGHGRGRRFPCYGHRSDDRVCHRHDKRDGQETLPACQARKARAL